MDHREFEELLRRGAGQFGLDLDGPAVQRLSLYFQELRRWSKKVNLIAKETSDEVIVEKHFIDSLALLMLVDERQDSLLDIGSGAGFPGLVCKIGRPQLMVSLVEPRLKRVSFLRQVIRLCDLKDITVQDCRLEEQVVLENESRFNCIVSRAVTDIPRFLAMCDRFCVKGSRVICMKGPRYRQELGEQPLCNKSWELTETHEYTLPFSQSSRVLLGFTCAVDE